MNFFLGHTHYSIDATSSLYSAKQANRHWLFRVQVNAKSSLVKVRKNISPDQRARFVAPFKKERRTPRLDSTVCHQRHTRKTYGVDRGACVASVPREIYNVHKAIRSASSNRDGGLTDHVPKDTMITKRQLDVATRKMLEKVLLLLDTDHKQSTMLQLLFFLC